MNITTKLIIKATRPFASHSQRKLEALKAVAFIMWLGVLALEAEARTNGQPQPDLQITQVNKLAALANSTVTEVEVRWTAQVPRSTTIDAFEVTLEVRYSDGSKDTIESNPLRPSARTVILRLPDRSKQGGSADLKDFKASLKARFKSASSLTVSQDFVAPLEPGAVRTNGSSSGGKQLEVSITEARLASHGCPTGQRCIDVRWAALAPRNISIGGFGVSLDVLHKDGTHKTASKNASALDRQARLSVEQSAGSEIASIKVTLLTNFYLNDLVIAVKEGSF